jgi:divalent metal cation (Fe/Co/Zn/Cd) transporter
MSTFQLPIAAPAAPTAAAPGRATIERLAQRARLLSWLSLFLVGAEGAVAITAGALASSIALVGFGLDSVIEGFASLVIVWRFTGARIHSQDAEDRAQRLVAFQFFLLAPYVGFESMRALVSGERPDETMLGIGLAIASVISMPILGIAKQRLAEQLGSAATRGEGRQNMLCAYMAAALLVGLVANALVGAYWLDPIVGLLIAGIALKEGREAWSGEGCCCTSDPLADLTVADRVPAATCDDACCTTS